MRARAASVLVLALFVLTACDSKAPSPEAGPPPSEAPPTAAPAPMPSAIFAPFPFSAEQIRDATPAGRHVVYRVVDPNGVTLTNMTFVQANEQGTFVKNRVTTESGALVGETESTNTWEDLKMHARYPADFTTITETEVAVAAGTFAAKLYEISDGRGGVETRAWFANELPGPPVKMENYREGQVIFSMELLENRVEEQAPAASTPQTSSSDG